ncbi:uracil-DNA glycosylase [Mycoplasmopsis canis UFG4]|uniref:Uracil-DNA glycosylase n=1 Tax=Mycoplasmopsis canis UFG4 TaxID=1131455 RepID=I1A5Q3_9BACT|nr:uracil-DNA glycosylase [Mycoplasmopsis canis]AKF40993.1 uracil-DNA glycosylase [Mycoplasmopsis canis]EIE41824.1 uracil-DNA glycosylase [Mycoplasmopsis canis UFG4]
MKDSFLRILQTEGQKPYFQNILKKLEESEKNNIQIFPHQMDMFRPFEFFQTNETKLIILGQDPYHQINIADGLAFSTNHIKTPASLKNIFKEVKKDYPNAKFGTNSLIKWAKQGVLLLNTVLTVEEGKPNSHKDIGWEKFVEIVIQDIILENPNVLILALGGQAHKVVENALKLRNYNKENLFKLSHPSPLGYRHSFENSNVFKKINDKLHSFNQKEIEWSL